MRFRGLGPQNPVLVIDGKRRSSRVPEGVAQVWNLLYRRFLICWRSAYLRRLENSAGCRLQIGDTAGSKPALLQPGLVMDQLVSRPRLTRFQVFITGGNVVNDKPRAGGEKYLRRLYPGFRSRTRSTLGYT